MRVFVAGATGVLGRRLVRQLTAKGHAVVGLARNPENAKRIRELGGEPRHWEFEEIEGERYHATGGGGAGRLSLCRTHYEERRRNAESNRRKGVGSYLAVHPVPSNREMAEAFKTLRGADAETQAHLDEMIRTLSRDVEPDLNEKSAGRVMICHDQQPDSPLADG